MVQNAIRLARLTRSDGTILMVPLDHGLSMGPLPGLAPPFPFLDALAGHATCLTVHKGFLRHVAPLAERLGILLHLSASTAVAPDPDDKRLVATVEEAVKAGCDGVSIHINVGSATEARQIRDAGIVSTACAEWGMPLLPMVYPRGPGIDDPCDPALVALAARLAAELGADAVKVPYTGDPATFRDVVQGAGIPVLVAGGPGRTLDDLIGDLRGAREAGAAGVSVGRNVFGAKDPATAMRRIAAVFP